MKDMIKKLLNIFAAGTDEKLYSVWLKILYPFHARKLCRQRLAAEQQRKEKILKIAALYASQEKKEEKQKVLQSILRLAKANSPVAYSSFPYDWAHNVYYTNKPEICSAGDMYTINLEGKKLFFPCDRRKKDIANYFKFVQLIEQDAAFPHKYINAKFTVDNGEIIADIGACEGNFSLLNIEKAKKVYLFEPEHKWAACLRETFKPWADKVEIVEKFVSDIDSDNSVTLDTFFQERERPTFVKADIEGFEGKMLAGGKELFASENPLKVALCIYHTQGDEQRYSQLFTELGYAVDVNSGYMVFYDEDENQMRFTHGVMHAVKA